ncbi:MAG: hypothetical protein HDR24_12275 [Lachnospiraceae bacterium]|nr:hypothetical protein [Lachnospiraceae bacterium]
MGQIKVTASAITKEEQLDIARLLVKAGYTVNIRKGKTIDGKGTSFINFNMEEREKQ